MILGLADAYCATFLFCVVALVSLSIGRCLAGGDGSYAAMAAVCVTLAVSYGTFVALILNQFVGTALAIAGAGVFVMGCICLADSLCETR